MSEVTFIIARVMKRNPLEVEAKKDSRLQDFGVDSLSYVEVELALEQYFGIEVPDHMALGEATPRKLERLVRNCLNQKEK